MEICPRIYRARRPRETPLYVLLESLYEQVELLWEERFEKRYGFWKGLWDGAVARYLDCGIIERGYVVTQSVLSLRYAHAVASDDHATASPAARANVRGLADGSSPVGR